jgi:hypothetical protein
MCVCRRLIDVVLFAVLLGLATKVTGAQPPLSSPGKLPSSVSLSDVQIQLTTGGGDGCVGRCTAWRIVVRGEGLIELHDLGTPPTAEPRRREIGRDAVVELVNQFLKVRFFEALGYYGGVGSARRN